MGHGGGRALEALSCDILADLDFGPPLSPPPTADVRSSEATFYVDISFAADLADLGGDPFRSP